MIHQDPISGAHERSSPNPDSERLMDLYNNEVGRRLALDPANAGREPLPDFFVERRGGEAKRVLRLVDGGA